MPPRFYPGHLLLHPTTFPSWHLHSDHPPSPPRLEENRKEISQGVETEVAFAATSPRYNTEMAGRIELSELDLMPVYFYPGAKNQKKTFGQDPGNKRGVRRMGSVDRFLIQATMTARIGYVKVR